MSQMLWIESIRLASFFASAIGLYILYNDASTQEDFGEASWNLLSFSFGYWIVNCVAHALQCQVCTEWTVALLSLKFTSLFSFLLTFSCVLSLPLNQIAARQQRTDP
jgi:hypothetical protein